MRRLVLVAIAAAAVAAGPAAASPTVRLTIVHVVHGCHVWQLGGRNVGSTTTLTLKRGTRVEIRSDCPMDFDLAQTSGPPLASASGRMFAGTTRAIVFARRGVYRLRATNVETSQDRGLATLGPDNGLSLTVRVT